MRTLITASLVAVLPILSGCIVGEIRDDLKATRAGVERLATLTPALEKTNASLGKTNEQLAALYREMVATRESVEVMPRRLDEANEHLKRSTEMLAHLEPMQASLRNLDESLAALRKIVENIDKAIPLVNFTKGTPSADKALEKSREGEKAAPEVPK
jgi:DNA repair ATPase RecN